MADPLGLPVRNRSGYPLGQGRLVSRSSPTRDALTRRGLGNTPFVGRRTEAVPCFDAVDDLKARVYSTRSVAIAGE